MKSVMVSIPTNLQNKKINKDNGVRKRWKRVDIAHSSPLLLRVPQRCSSDSVVDQGKKGLLDQQLRVKHHQLGRGRNEIIAFVE